MYFLALSDETATRIEAGTQILISINDIYHSPITKLRLLDEVDSRPGAKIIQDNPGASHGSRKMENAQKKKKGKKSKQRREAGSVPKNTGTNLEELPTAKAGYLSNQINSSSIGLQSKE